MANKYDLKTWSKIGLKASTGASGTNIGSSAVPAGKVRFLTYIRVTRSGINGAAAVVSLAMGIGEVTTSKPQAASVLNADYLKLPIRFTKTSKTAVPESSFIQEIRGSIEHPILSVASEKYMGINASLTLAELSDVFAQYYDE